MAKKSPASERTIDMFAGVKDVVTPNEIESSTEDTHEAPKSSETIEQAADRWRATAFYAAEFFSKSWGDVKDGTKYRLTTKDGMMFLETFGIRSGKAYSWSGVSFPQADLYEITSVFVKASRTKQEQEKANGRD